MKNIFGFLLVAVLMFTGGCKLDDATVPSSLQNPLLIGKWYLSDLTIVTKTGLNDVTETTIDSYTDQDYFEFRTGNAATYSSTTYAKTFIGYYSSNSTTTPTTLSFKSGDLLLQYQIQSLDATELVVYDESSTKDADGTITTITNYYTYKR
jgi:hypothetical protein